MSQQMPSLTRTERRYIAACGDWKAAFEVVEILNRPQTIRSRRLARTALNGLVGRGLLRFSPANDTFRATSAGRALLPRKAP